MSHVKVLRDFLSRLDTDDNRSTAHPILFLLQVQREVVADGDYNYDKIVYYHSDVCESRAFDTLEECEQALKEYGHEGEELESAIEEIQKLYISHYWETVNVFLTEEGLKRHIEINKHNLGKYRDYVIHAFRNPEMKELYDAIRGLVNETA